MIRFRKDTPRYWFMSNYYSCEFVMNGIRYKNAEAAFQSHKVPLEERKQFSDMPPATAKHFGRHVAFPANWDETRDDVMRRVVMAKFEQNKDLKQRLLETGTQPIEEDTTSWHDNYWGNCHCPKCRNIPGQNRLGIILMETKDKLKKQTSKKYLRVISFFKTKGCRPSRVAAFFFCLVGVVAHMLEIDEQLICCLLHTCYGRFILDFFR